jgi:hypothetical protein
LRLCADLSFSHFEFDQSTVWKVGQQARECTPRGALVLSSFISALLCIRCQFACFIYLGAMSLLIGAVTANILRKGARNIERGTKRSTVREAPAPGDVKLDVSPRAGRGGPAVAPSSASAGGAGLQQSPLQIEAQALYDSAASDAGVSNGTKSSSGISFTPANLLFKNLSYTVSITDEQGVVSEKRLLSRVSGYAKAGTLTALMGASGAGSQSCALSGGTASQNMCGS